LTARIRQREATFGSEEIRAVEDVLKSGWITEGRKTAEFEEAIASLTRRKYTVAISSGGVALFVALKAAGIGAGDEVVCPVYNMIALPNAVTLAGAKPVFVDVSSSNGNINVEKLSEGSPDARAIVPIHMNGRNASMLEIGAFARDHGLVVIEDACQALGSKLNDVPLGTGSSGSLAACISFHPSKIVTTGTGGAVVTDDEEFALKVRALKDYGQTTRGKVEQLPDNYKTWGLNFRFTDIQAAIGLAQLQKLEERMAHISWLYRFYNKEIDHSFRLSLDDQNGFLPWCCDIRLKKPVNEKLKGRLLSERGVETRLPYKPMHLQPLYASSAVGDFPGGVETWQTHLWLPTGPHVNEERARYVAEAVNEVGLRVHSEN